LPEWRLVSSSGLRHGKRDRAKVWSSTGRLASPTAPVLPDLRAGGGFTISVQFNASTAQRHASSTIISAFSNVTAALGEEPTDRRITKGYAVSVTESGEIELFITDGFVTSFRHATRIGVASGIWDGRDHTVSFTLDGGPNVATIVVDERLDDGGDAPQGWAFHPAELGEIAGSDLVIDPTFGGTLQRLMIFDRPLLTSESIATARALLLPR
jgi:hypothetical protein